MRELRIVGPGDDAEHVRVETLDGSEQFSLRVDDALRSHLPTTAPVSTRVAPEPDTAIRPREIQVRVRAGEAPNVLADEAGISIDRVLLFAAPVLEERSRMAGEARRARARRSTPEGQLVNFGEAVDERFLAHGIDPASVTWDSHRREDGQWVVSAGWRGGESDRVAEWAFSLSTRAVTPLDETAADLLSDRPIRPVVSAVPKLRLDPMADAPTGPLPRAIDLPAAGEFPAAGDEELFDYLDEPAPDPHQTPPLPLQLVEPAEPAKPRAAKPQSARPQSAKPQSAKPQSAKPQSAGPHIVQAREEETEEQKAARARIPSWDDILLGVRRKRD